jgi:hypothetical protein
MGMSSSQARLLTLTGRLHSIEIKAQKLEAEKLRLANDSDRVYDNYLQKLEATKIQYSTLESDGSMTYKDATLNSLENGIVSDYTGDTSSNTLFLQDSDGKILVTPAVANKYGLTSSGNDTRDLDTFVEDTTGKSKTEYPLTRQVPVYREEQTLSTREVEDTDKVESFTKVANSVATNPTPRLNLTPVKNTTSVQTFSFNNFQNTSVSSHSTSVDGLQNLNSVSNLVSGKQYVVTDSAGLLKLKEIVDSGNDCSGVTIVMGSNIDMSETTDWAGIGNYNNNFCGTFDGNGYVISNLTGSQGLFDVLGDGAVVKNVGLEDVDINKLSQDSSNTGTGGIAGKNKAGSTISNCYVTGSIVAPNKIGGIVGENGTDWAGGTIENCNVSAALTSTDSSTANIGGIAACSNGTITGCNVEGTFNGGSGSTVGGILGYSCSSSTIADCTTTAVLNGGSYVGSVISSYSAGTYVLIDNITYNENNPYKLCGSTSVNTSDWDCSPAKTIVNTPSVGSDYTGGFYSNIIGALAKNGTLISDIDTDKVKRYIQNLCNDSTNGLSIANINSYLYDYVKGSDTTGGAFITALENDIKNGTTVNTTAPVYQNVYSSDSFIGNITTNTSDSWNADAGLIKGSVIIPSVNTIADELYYALKQYNSNITFTNDDVKNWINTVYSPLDDDTNKMYLANLNDDIQNGSNLALILRAYNSNSIYANSSNYSTSSWIVTIGRDTTVTPTYGTKEETYWDGVSTHEVLDHYEDEIYDYEERWDTTDSDISNAIAMYAMSKRGVTVITDAQANSNSWLTNMINEGQAVLTTFDPSKVDSLSGLTDDEISNMTDEEYNEMMGIENTSVSVSTFLDEVSDKTGVKKAEAEYEADMKKIDRKDSQYDTQIASCETERTAIKDEMDSLKTVKNDNVERTFKLFS